MEQEESAYITSVHLKGYKSIRDVSVTLNKGLNILIGANGSGKTNFLEFLDAAYRSDYEILLNGRKFEADIKGKPYSIKLEGERTSWSDEKTFAYKVEKTVYKTINRSVKKRVESIFLDEEKKVVETLSQKVEFPFSFAIFKSTLLIKFANPLTEILNKILSLDLVRYELQEGYFFLSSIKSRFPSFLYRVFLKSSREAEFNKAIEIITEITDNQWFTIDALRQNLNQFSPIKDIRIDWGLTRRTIKEEEQSATIEGIDFQFFVNNEWINWTQLSDGTKRLFYLIGSVTYAKENEIILIEEPELGVHPHQLALLMNFLKSESDDKQIIISTHSPQVLNCLKGEELDRIIVARHEGKAGTKLYHLSEEEKGYASEFMEKEAFLSDYWMLSGFMNEEMPEDV
jgi:predicted ATP-dependent endonuclease of OLD family